jgi:hypothetical protein
MRLKGREAVATVNVMRHIAEAAAVTLKGVRRFWERTYPGMVVGFKGKAGAERYYTSPYRDVVILLVIVPLP